MTNTERMQNTARRLIAEGETEQFATDYIVGFYGVSEFTAQLAVLAVRPSGVEGFFNPGDDESIGGSA